MIHRGWEIPQNQNYMSQLLFDRFRRSAMIGCSQQQSLTHTLIGSGALYSWPYNKRSGITTILTNESSLFDIYVMAKDEKGR